MTYPRIMALALILLGAQSACADQGATYGPPGRDHGDTDRRHEERDHDKDRRQNDQRVGAQGPMRRPGWAQDRGDAYRWQRGERMGYNDWNRAERIDYRRHHLRKPPRGYEWRRSNDQYVLAAVATGVITSIILNSGR